MQLTARRIDTSMDKTPAKIAFKFQSQILTIPIPDPPPVISNQSTSILYRLMCWLSGSLGKGKGKGLFLELFQHWGHLAYCILAPNKFPHSSPEAPRIIQMRETSTSEGGNYYLILLANSNLRKSARIFYMPQSWGIGQILLLPLRRKAYWGFSGHPKNRTASAWFEPANSCFSGQYGNH